MKGVVMAASAACAPDCYEIPIQSRSVSRLFVRTGFDISMFEDGCETTIRIEDLIAVVTENPRPLVKLEAEDGLTPALGVFGKIVVSGNALRAERNTLDIAFYPGVWFQVEPKYEPASWGPYGSKGLIIICMPGSEMAVWFGMKRNRRFDDVS
jgi:Family of unknown function (DUF6188)